MERWDRGCNATLRAFTGLLRGCAWGAATWALIAGLILSGMS
jgi:hypothetical protein